MQLNIINPTAPSFHEAVGISEERANELLRALNDMIGRSSQSVLSVKRFSKPAPTFNIYSAYNEIASLCNNLEEVLFCTIVFVEWYKTKGWQLNALKKKVKS